MRRSAPWGRVVVAGVCLWGVILFLLWMLLANYPSLLQTHDVLLSAPAIAVLNGDTFFRVEKGLALHVRYGSEIWLTGDPAIGAELDGGTASNRRCLRDTHQLAADKIRILSDQITTVSGRILAAVFGKTVVELGAIEREMARRNMHQVIIVTSRYHGRRVRALWGLSPSRWFRRAIIQHPETDAYSGPSHAKKEAFMTVRAWLVPWSLIMNLREAARTDKDESASVPPTNFVCKGDGAPS